jgi:hypothetical protein
MTMNPLSNPFFKVPMVSGVSRVHPRKGTLPDQIVKVIAIFPYCTPLLCRSIPLDESDLSNCALPFLLNIAIL